ncbi:hypothetical protein A2230_04270 [candidate division WOR-1 bacterium RIFOXYA2_FULL_36_21]|uniref:DUF948 domain-containing protein n=1 Tax=candidate division WOR-1 bacterium RIFOXYB2_FULL_36_35 TaxID=1802578 RepID=A0A1F4RYB2_UNCSA|nr:MAG: hypothetical protein A2230_04270 [candidate division WOR-1 bacterium RIFOXYA2_FULL_36_21]OGC13160.1 MAG: hypothetical protein A2290_07615 [candidate division WOR-1 bacterium RIFOXYB2_FULL_36_35]OGC18596.1 MAG: hypothetical protein A2282_04550 [candidate division WOR-1 bacterium RIFOXYA12_FULL_36_13]
MIEIYLKNILLGALIILVIVFIFAVIQIVFILFDLRKIVSEAKKLIKDLEKRIKAISSVLDIATLILGGLEEVKSRLICGVMSKTNFAALIAGLKKGFSVFTGGDKK